MTVLAHLYCSPGVHICFLCYCIFEYRGERRATGRGCRRSPIAFCPTLSPLPFSSAVFRFPSRSAHLWWQSVNDLVSSRFSPLEALIRVLFVLSPSLPPPSPRRSERTRGTGVLVASAPLHTWIHTLAMLFVCLFFVFSFVLQPFGLRAWVCLLFWPVNINPAHPSPRFRLRHVRQADRKDGGRRSLVSPDPRVIQAALKYHIE